MGCSSLTGLFGGNKEEDYVPDDPADKLYNEGLYLLNKKQDYEAAAKKFDEVDRQNPYSDWARKALLMSAYSYYQAQKYDDCINSAKRYVTLHPGQPGCGLRPISDRRLLLRPDSRTSRGIRRGPTKPSTRSKKWCANIPTPNTPSAPRRRSRSARDQLAGKEMEVGRFYMKRRDFTGAINRFKVVVTQYQTTREVEEALERLTEAYVSLGILDEAQTAAAVLGHNFPDSSWYKDAYKLVKSAGVEPSENKDSWISRAFKGMG